MNVFLGHATEMASLINGLPHGDRISVCLGINAEAVSFVASLPGAERRTSAYDDAIPFVIESVWATVDGVRFHAQTESRPATSEEIGKLRLLGQPAVCLSADVGDWRDPNGA